MNFRDDLEILLMKDERFVVNGKLLRSRVLKIAKNPDKRFMHLLMSNEKVKNYFFIDIDGTYVFLRDKFIDFVNKWYFSDISHASFKSHIFTNDKVILLWQYRDYIFEGGVIKENDKKDDVFYNRMIAIDDITTLLEPKVFTNFKRVCKHGEKPVKEIKDTDNFIIMGNNLLVLHSLKKRFSGKVKLIYIDPPYNTGSSAFKYNDRFTHSIWLTFMKNRLEVAKELLRDDGIIFVQIDDNELAHLKVLMDEIFGDAPSGRSNFVQYVEIKANVGAANEYQNPFMPKNCEYGLIYAKNYDKRKYKPIWVKSKVDRHYKYIILNFEEKNFRKWKIGRVMEEFVKEYGEENRNNDDLLYEFVIRNIDRIFRTITPKHPGKNLKAALEKSKRDTWSVYKRKKGDEIICYKGEMIRFYSKNLKKDINGNLIIGTELGSLWTDIAWQGIASEGGVKLKHGKKPEKLLRRIIEMFTEPGEIVLDFCLGSGTTAAVAHKMGRQYIGIEQLDYGENSAFVRLKNVINGEQTGISKDIGWKGGGEFIFMELKKLNEKFVHTIMDAKSTEELWDILKEIKKRTFFSSKDMHKKFENLSLESMKEALIGILDKYNLYMNYNEIDKIEYEIRDEEKKLNKMFYGDSM